MTLNEAKQLYLNHYCDVCWDPLDRPARKNEAIPVDTVGVYVNEIYENCYGEVLFGCDRKVYSKFDVRRLRNPRKER